MKCTDNRDDNLDRAESHVREAALRSARLNPRVVRVQRKMRKWGSCSSAGTITLAADHLDESDGFQDFVVAHELLHLRVPNHGWQFKALMSAHVPAWRSLAVSRGKRAEI